MSVEVSQLGALCAKDKLEKRSAADSRGNCDLTCFKCSVVIVVADSVRGRAEELELRALSDAKALVLLCVQYFCYSYGRCCR